ncbi:GyrI-like domain-containing protein [Prevotella sp. 10(H)]|uniref:GyrI-like domain-containing protein n=1 Tax=Prevotella sp. 10(H) TaxID=1158294 RepID=UPI0004A6D0E4|nr:GyrI-like domain-containing protein [Prevotella sp. 10(H)]
MKNPVKFLLTIVIAIIVIITATYAYYGGFRSVNFEVKEAGGETMVYTDLTGDYGQTALYMDTVYYTLLNEYGIATTKGAGIYYDNPQHVEKSKLRSDIGCLLDSPLDSLKTAQISSKFKIKTIPQKTCTVTEFPFKGFMSVMVGIIKIYPALNNYIEENGYKAAGPTMEIYDTPNKTIIYRQEIEKP